MDHEVRSSRPAVAHILKPRVYQKQKISWAWGQAPVIPATWEAGTGESPEPGRQRQGNDLNQGGGGCSELRFQHCAPAWVTE